MIIIETVKFQRLNIYSYYHLLNIITALEVILALVHQWSLNSQLLLSYHLYKLYKAKTNPTLIWLTALFYSENKN
jgi:hypothetical protein